MTIPQQLAPTVGPVHGGVEFLEGSPRIKRLVIDWMKKNWHETTKHDLLWIWEYKI